MQKKLAINCTGATFMPLDDLLDFQGKIKNLPEKNAVKLKQSIEEFGFSAPIFIWKDQAGKCWLMDGHQRTKILRVMREEGWEIPPLPVDFIEAKTRTEAKKKLMVIISQYGEVNVNELQVFFPQVSHMAGIIRLPDRELNISLAVDDVVDPDMVITPDVVPLEHVCPKCGTRF